MLRFYKCFLICMVCIMMCLLFFLQLLAFRL
jgi:hypothetical protein